jgi:hypothetical protein
VRLASAAPAVWAVLSDSHHLACRPNGLYNVSGGGGGSSAAGWWRRPLALLGGGGKASAEVRLELVHGGEVWEARQTFADWATLITRCGASTPPSLHTDSPLSALLLCWLAATLHMLTVRPGCPLASPPPPPPTGCTAASGTWSWSGRWGPSPLRTGWAARWCWW